MLFSRSRFADALPTPAEALPGRSVPAYAIPSRHAFLDAPLQGPFPDGLEIARVAMGCFWGAERAFWSLPGVYSTAVGYQGGLTPYPTYDEVCTGRTGHAEAVQIVYDPAQLSYAELLRTFWEKHNPTQGNRQGNDRGTGYRSAIYYADEAQREVAESSRDAYAEDLAAAGHGPITTEIAPGGPFYYAEADHQQYLHHVPNGYCSMSGTGVSCPVGLA